MTTATDLVNRALNLIGGNQDAVTGTYPNFDTSAAGTAAKSLYPGVVQTIGREWGYDFSRSVAALALSGNAAPFPWTYEYLYPTNGIQVRQLMPPAAGADLNDPLPLNWSVGNALVSAVQTKVIWTNEAAAQAVFTNQPIEGTWDPLFTEAVVRLLASELAMALEGKPDTAQSALEQAGQFGAVAHSRDS